jgi:catalase
LGGPNFAHLPVNRPVADVRNNQRDGYSQHTIAQGPTSYYKNTLAGGCPALADEDVFRHYTERVDGHKIRERAESFKDYYSQPRLFWDSMSAVEADHIVAAFAFELGKVGPETGIRPRVVEQLNLIDHDLAARVAAKLGLTAPAEVPIADRQPPSPALSQLNATPPTITSRRIAVLAADGVDVRATEGAAAALRRLGAKVDIISSVAGGTVRCDTGHELGVDLGINTTSSALYDAVLVPGGAESVEQLAQDGSMVHFVTEAYKHLKPIAAFGAGIDLLQVAGVRTRPANGSGAVSDDGVITSSTGGDDLDDGFIGAFVGALERHRAWDRVTDMVSA